ncbi:hypothetical protein [Candidatus Amarolinea dominans]
MTRTLTCLLDETLAALETEHGAIWLYPRTTKHAMPWIAAGSRA